MRLQAKHSSFHFFYFKKSVFHNDIELYKIFILTLHITFKTKSFSTSFCLSVRNKLKNLFYQQFSVKNPGEARVGCQLYIDFCNKINSIFLSPVHTLGKQQTANSNMWIGVCLCLPILVCVLHYSESVSVFLHKLEAVGQIVSDESTRLVYISIARELTWTSCQYIVDV